MFQMIVCKFLHREYIGEIATKYFRPITSPLDGKVNIKANRKISTSLESGIYR